MFGGIGGFDLALKRNGWDNVGYYEKDKYAVDIYNRNFKTNWRPVDITKVRTEDVPEHSILCAGFPCQAFSIAGNRMGFEDTRGTMFFEVARIIKDRRPQIVLLENVKGLLSHDNRKTFASILTTLDELGYNVEWQIVNSKHYGVAQSRERIFIIGHIRTGCGRQIFPLTENAGQIQGTLGKPKMMGLVEQTFNKRVHDTPPEINEFLKKHKGGYIVKQITKYLDAPITQVEHYFRTDEFRSVPSPDVWKKLKRLLQFPDTYDQQVTEIYEKEIEYETSRRVWDSTGISPTLNATKEHTIREPTKVFDRKGFSSRADGFKETVESAPTLSTKMGTGGNNVPMIVQKHQDFRQGKKPLRMYEETSPTIRADMGDTQPMVRGKEERLRRLTPIECERLQGFPDNWTAGVSDTQRYKTLGNAVTVNVIEAIIQKINEVSIV